MPRLRLFVLVCCLIVGLVPARAAAPTEKDYQDALSRWILTKAALIHLEQCNNAYAARYDVVTKDAEHRDATQMTGVVSGLMTEYVIWEKCQHDVRETVPLRDRAVPSLPPTK